jgi:predicted nucleotidyltransferase
MQDFLYSHEVRTVCGSERPYANSVVIHHFMTHEYLESHPENSANPIYSLVPPIMKALLNENPEIHGFALGGSYAAGNYQKADDIDFDILYESYPQRERKEEIEASIVELFTLNNLSAHIRAPLAANALPDNMRSGMYMKHPNTPYVVRDRATAEKWGLLLTE